MKGKLEPKPYIISSVDFLPTSSSLGTCDQFSAGPFLLGVCGPTKQIPQFPNSPVAGANSVCAPSGSPVDQSEAAPPASANGKWALRELDQWEVRMPLKPT